MRQLIVCVVAGGAWLAVNGPTSAQTARPPDILARIGDIRAESPDTRSPALIEVLSTPTPVQVTSVTDGAQLGTAQVLSVSEEPTWAFHPTAVKWKVGDDELVVADVVSQDEKFRVAFGYTDSPNGPTDFFAANMLRVDSSPGTAEVLIRLQSPQLVATAGPTINSAFTFLESPNLHSFPTVIYSDRRSSWSEIKSFGQAISTGDNFNLSATTPSQAFVVNVLRSADQQSGFVVVCVTPGRPCGVAGFGTNSGSFGRAVAGNAGAFGLVPVPNAVSLKDFIFQVSGTEFGRGGCIAGKPIPPGKPWPVERSGNIRVSWEWMNCADDYVVRLLKANGTFTDVIQLGTTWTGSSRDFPGVTEVAIASASNGVVSDFSAASVVHRLN